MSIFTIGHIWEGEPNRDSEMTDAVTRAHGWLNDNPPNDNDNYGYASTVMRDLLAEIYQLRGALNLIGYGTSSSWEYYQYIARESLKI